MKKTSSKFGALVFATLLSVLLGCDAPYDTEITPSIDDNTNPIKLVGNTLKFATIKDYESIFENLGTISLPEFTSFKNYTEMDSYNLRFSDNGQSYLDELEGSIILELLDKDGMIIIEDNLIFLDFENKVTVLTKEHSLKESILKRNYNDTRITVFSFEDDVLEIIQTQPEHIESQSEDIKQNLRVMQNCPGTFPIGSTTPTMNGNGCDSRKCELEQIYNGGPGGHDYRAKMKHVYQPVGIYFRLKSELEFHRRSHPSGSWSAYPTSMNITYWGSYKPNNRSTENISGCQDGCQGCFPQPVNTLKVQKVHWESTRRLTQYNIYGIYEYFTYNLGTDAVQLYNIQRN